MNINSIGVLQNLDIRISFALIFFGATLVWDARKRIKHKQRMKDTPTLPISAATAGQVEVEAIVWPIKNIYTTLNGEHAIYFDYQLQKNVKSGKNSEWVTVWHKFSATPFLAFDHTGFVRIFPSKVNDSLDSKTTNWGSLSNVAKKHFVEIFDGKKSDLPNMNDGLFSKIFTPPYRVIEKKIQIGSPILINGNFLPFDKLNYVNISATLKLFHERVCRIMSSKKLATNLLDSNNDGKIDEKELQSGFSRTLKGCIQAARSIQSAHLQEFITEIKNESDESFQTSETQANKKFKVYGDIVSNQNHEMDIINSFQDQYLNKHPIWINWLLFIFGITFLAIATLTIFIKFSQY